MLDYIFIFPLQMGMQGAALATLLGKLANLAYIIYYFNSKKTIIRIKPGNLRLKKSIVKEVTGVGMSGLGMRSSGSIAVITLNHTPGSPGWRNSHRCFCNYLPCYFVYSDATFRIKPRHAAHCRALISAPESSPASSKLSRQACYMLSFSGYLLWASPSCFLKPSFLYLRTDKELIEYGTGAFVTVVSMMWVMGIYTTGTGIHQALGKETSSFILSIMRWVLLIIPLVLILPKFLYFPSVDGIWLAFPIADLLAALITLLILRRTLRISRHIIAFSIQRETLTLPRLLCISLPSRQNKEI
ncbi:MAG: hypothetical protein U5L09_06345 [Bacteroidales bacterium]|nr:hypothetical protein [Bacteroidales bacterium]